MARLSPVGTLTPLDYKRYFTRVRAVGGPDAMAKAFRVTMRRWPRDADKAYLGATLAAVEANFDNRDSGFENGETGFGGNQALRRRRAMTEITTATGYLVNGHLHQTRKAAEAHVKRIRASKLCSEDDAFGEGRWTLRDAIVELDNCFPGLIDFIEQQKAQSDGK